MLISSDSHMNNHRNPNAYPYWLLISNGDGSMCCPCQLHFFSAFSTAIWKQAFQDKENNSSGSNYGQQVTAIVANLVVIRGAVHFCNVVSVYVIVHVFTSTRTWANLDRAQSMRYNCAQCVYHFGLMVAQVTIIIFAWYCSYLLQYF